MRPGVSIAGSSVKVGLRRQRILQVRTSILWKRKRLRGHSPAYRSPVTDLTL